MAIRTQTNTHPFLRALVPEHRSILLEGAAEQSFEAGEILFREGQPANRLYLIQQGRISLETHVPGKGDLGMATVGPGQVLGWSWLVPPFVWHFQARGVENGTVIVLNGAHVLVACERNHYLGFELMKNIAKVILDVLLAAHQRWLETGHRPVLADQPGAKPLDRSTAVGGRLVEHPFLHGMKPEFINVLAELATPKEYEPGQIVFEPGDLADGLYVVESGNLVLEAPFAGEIVQVQSVHGGDAVGWSSFCEPYEWQFGCRALHPSSILFFKAAELRERFAADYHLGYEMTKRITRMMLQRLQSTRNRMWEALR